MIEYRERITRQMVRSEPATLFVFGDNLARVGLGGQAKEMRGEPNAVGIVTKKEPTMREAAFFKNTWDDALLWNTVNREAVERLIRHNGLIVWPKAGIGTGLAQLARRSPKIWREIEELIEVLEGR